MANVPLATRMRPGSFDELVGQRHLFGPGRALTSLLQGGHLPSLILWGPAGTGKTTLAHLLAKEGTITLIGATTENPYFSLVTPLLSRCLLLRLEPLAAEDLRVLMERALQD